MTYVLVAVLGIIGGIYLGTLVSTVTIRKAMDNAVLRGTITLAQAAHIMQDELDS